MPPNSKKRISTYYGQRFGRPNDVEPVFDARYNTNYPEDFEVSDKETYQLSKYYPGEYKNMCTYTPSGQMTAAMPVSNGFALSQGTQNGAATAVDLGTHAYTVIAFCPVLSHLVINDEASVINGQQCSGLICMTSNNLLAQVNVNEFFGMNAAGTAGSGLASYLSMTNAYGFTSTTELENFVYASKLDAKFVVPMANLTGTYFQGKMRLGQFFTTGTSGASAYVTIGNLIRAADKTSSMKTGFTLRSSMVNDYLLTHTLKNGSEAVTDYLSDEALGSEIIDYVVLQTPAINITTGASSIYSLICEMSSQATVMASPDNLLLYRSFDTIAKHKQSNEIDFNYSPVPDIVLETTPPPTTKQEVKDLVRKMDSRTLASSTDYLDRPYEPQESQVLRSLEEIKDAVSVEGETSVPKFMSRKEGALLRCFELYREKFIKYGLLPKDHQALRIVGLATLGNLASGMKIAHAAITKSDLLNRAKSAASAMNLAKKRRDGPMKTGFGVVKSFLANDRNKTRPNEERQIHDAEKEIEYVDRRGVVKPQGKSAIRAFYEAYSAYKRSGDKRSVEKAIELYDKLVPIDKDKVKTEYSHLSGVEAVKEQQ